MKQIHVECDPDEVLVKKIGFTRKQVRHHSGKGKLFNRLQNESNHLAMVDEDSGCNMSQYEKNLQFLRENHGIKVYQDRQQNKVIVLKIKLEDWIINACKLSNLKPSVFNLPSDPNELHSVINSRMSNYGNLLDRLLETENPAILRLKEELE